MLTSDGYCVINYENSQVLDNTWTTYSLSREDSIEENTTLNIEDLGAVSKSIPDILTNTEVLYLGSTSSDSIIGNFSEVWFAKDYVNKDTISFIDKSLKDNIVSISKNYVQGYITEYNRAAETTVVSFDYNTPRHQNQSRERFVAHLALLWGHFAMHP